jgi:peptide/nickel transport system ATP-binding protein
MVGLIAVSMFAHRYPHELSGGQRQRVNIARALDHSAAAADSRRGGLGARQVGRGAGAQPPAELKRNLELTYIFISHDLNVDAVSSATACW